MPQYSFECQACRKTFEIEVSMSDYVAMQKSKTIVCAECGSTKVARVFTVPVVTRSTGDAPSASCGPGCCCG